MKLDVSHYVLPPPQLELGMGRGQGAFCEFSHLQFDLYFMS